MDPILRHVAACNNAVLPGDRIPLLLDAGPVGWVAPATVEPLIDGGAVPAPRGLHVTPARLDAVARRLAGEGRFPWRHEDFDVRATPDGPALMRLDRGALPEFGIAATGVHLNALVERPDGTTLLWVARRARTKLLDPGKLDHLVAGGVPAGLSPAETLVKEAAEEAGLPPELARSATPVAVVEYAMDRPEGLRRDRLHCFDLVLPDGFRPVAHDGEVESFELWPLPEVLRRVRDTDDFKFNVNLVLIDLFRRRGLLG